MHDNTKSEETTAGAVVVELRQRIARLTHLCSQAQAEFYMAEIHHRELHELLGTEVEPREERLALLLELAEVEDEAVHEGVVAWDEHIQECGGC